MIYKMGERVVINLDIDGYKVGDNLVFGFVSQCKIYSKKLPGTLTNAVLTVVIGDDNQTYCGLSLGTGPSTPNTFANFQEFKTMLKVKDAEILKEVDLIENYENLYMDAIMNRLSIGMNINAIKEDYNNFIVEKLQSLKEHNEALKYLTDNYWYKFSEDPFDRDKTIDDEDDDDEF